MAAALASTSTPEKEKPVELGFVEVQPDSWRLASAFFVSKMGGKPSWLNLKELPGPKDLKCGSCDGPLRFLIQIYAPLDSDETFHRTIFLFLCSKKHCCVERNSNKNLVALRCQLKVENEFYSSEPPGGDKSLADIGPEKFGVKVCRICGSLGPQHCGNCKKVNYCTAEHQTLDWKSGHKTECVDPDFKLTTQNAGEQHNFPELEIVIDTEVIPKASKKDKKKNALEEYKKLVSEGKAGTLDDTASTKDMLEAASYKSDKAFNKFKRRVAYHSDQVLRYDRTGEPLWVSGENTLEKADIPPCNYCKGPRVFEFQVMPQLLNHLGEESVSGALDWGTIAVYTCENNCSSGSGYKTEFVYRQDFKPDAKDD